MTYIIPDDSASCKKELKKKTCMVSTEDPKDEIGYITYRDRKKMMERCESVKVFTGSLDLEKIFDLGMACGLKKTIDSDKALNEVLKECL